MASEKRNLAAPSKPDEEVTINVKKIANGYITRRSSYDKNGNYKSEEHYTETAPVIPVPVAPKTPAKAAPKTAARAAPKPASPVRRPKR